MRGQVVVLFLTTITVNSQAGWERSLTKVLFGLAKWEKCSAKRQINVYLNFASKLWTIFNKELSIYPRLIVGLGLWWPIFKKNGCYNCNVPTCPAYQICNDFYGGRSIKTILNNIQCNTYTIHVNSDLEKTKKRNK